MKIITLLLILNILSCGSASDSKKTTTSKEWSLDQISATEVNCENGMFGSGYDNTQITTYCNCMVEDVAKKYSYDDYARNQTSVNQALIKDGTTKSCVKAAGIK